MCSDKASSQKELFRKCRHLRKGGHDTQVAGLLADTLRRDGLDADGVLHAGRMLRQLDADNATEDGITVSLLGQCTTSWLSPAVTAIARGRGYRIRVDEKDYDNVFQGIRSLGSGIDAVILLPWSQRLFGNTERAPSDRVNDELDFWRSVWSVAGEHTGTRVIQVGYDWPDAGAGGHHNGAADDSDIGLVRQLNDALRHDLPAGAYFVDLEQVSGMFGRVRFYDQRRYYWTKQPFSDEGVVRLASHLWSGIRSTLFGPKKVLVLDLDNTLWAGVVGETGPLGIDVGETPAGEAFSDFQRLLKALGERGCILAVCSKNNPEDAREPFTENPDMVLSLDDFAAFEASWDSKASAIQKISKNLNLGLDSFVFFDDEAAEREQIRQALPEVEVIDVPDDPADYRQALLSGLWFESIGVTAEDRKRTVQYRNELIRSESRSSAGSVDEYLQSLEMFAEIEPIGDANLDRVVQLIGKTNQFNLTTRRHSREAVCALLARPASIGLALRMRDRFGDYGLVSLVMATADTEENRNRLRIDTWLMSCRVIGRTAEHFLFNALIEQVAATECCLLVGDYIPSNKNAVVADLYGRLGFSPCKTSIQGTEQFELIVADATAAATFVTSTALE